MGWHALPGVEMGIIHVVPRILAPPGLLFDRATARPGLDHHVEAAVARAGGAPAVQVSEEVLWGDRPDREIMVRRALIGGTAVWRAAPRQAADVAHAIAG